MKLVIRIFLLVAIFFPFWGFSQMNIEGDTLHGNEWINFNQDYYKIDVGEDGIYRILYDTLSADDFPINLVRGDQMRIFHRGKEVHIHVSTDGVFQNDDFIEFYGYKNDGHLDQFLYRDPADQLRTDFSLYSDTSSYFLTWDDAPNKLRIVTIENDVSNPSEKEEYCYYETRASVNSTVYKNLSGNREVSDYDPRDGFGQKAATVAKTITATNFVPTDGAYLNIRFSTYNSSGNIPAVVFNGDTLYKNTIQGYNVLGLTLPLPTGNLKKSNELRLVGTNSNISDQNFLGFAHLTYPRNYKFPGVSNFTFSLKPSIEERYVEIEDFDMGDSDPLVYFPYLNVRSFGFVENDLVKISIPEHNDLVEVYISDQQQGIQYISSVSKVKFNNFLSQSPNFLILSHKTLIDGGSIQEYADYRASLEGGSFSPQIVDIVDIYNQFGYGLKYSPLAVRNFLNLMLDTQTSLDYIFIIGKGYHYQYSKDNSEGMQSTFFVPTFGLIPSDNMLVSDLNDVIPKPRVAIGRIPATNTQEVLNYLEKVKIVENYHNLPHTIEDKQWLKHVFQFTGGKDEEQQNDFTTLMRGAGSILEHNKMGAYISEVHKNNSEPSTTSKSQVYFDNLEEGSAIMSYLGHGSISSISIGISDPHKINNYGKFPWMNILGCSTGNIFTPQIGIAHNYTFYANKGCVAYCSDSHLGSAGTLMDYLRTAYYNTGELYGERLGKILKATYAELSDKIVVQQMILSGDPAIKLYSAPGQDYVFDPASFAHNPASIHTETDSININVDIVNLGQNLSDSVSVKMERELPDGNIDTTLNIIFLSSSFSTQTSFKIPVLGDKAAGINRIYMTIDQEDLISEKPVPDAEMNNDLVDNNGTRGMTIFVNSNDAIPVYPPNYAIVGHQDITLKASTINPLLKDISYIFQIDTVKTFNSPLIKSGEVLNGSGVIKWKPDINFENEQEYFWRISRDSTEQSGYNWKNSSFIYIENSQPGWNQSHKGQFEENDLNNLTFDSNNNFDFSKNHIDVRIINRSFSVQDPTFAYEWLNNSGPNYRIFYRPQDGGVRIVIFNPYTAFRPPDITRKKQLSWKFKTEIPEDRHKLISFLEDSIQTGEYVMFLTSIHNDYPFGPENFNDDLDSLGKSIFTLLEAQGATQISSLDTLGSVPVILIYKKDEGLITEMIGKDSLETIEFSYPFPYRWDKGDMVSSLIGPAKSWNSFSWLDERDLDDIMPDSLRVQILGIENKDSIGDLLYEGETSEDLSLGFIDATEYPYLQLKLSMVDSNARSAEQLLHWRVWYHGYPDFAVNPSFVYHKNLDTINQGEDFKLIYGIENVNNIPSDSLLISYSFRNDKNESFPFSKRIKPLGAEEQIVDTLLQNTLSLKGDISFNIELNPTDDQPELTRFNNFLIDAFNVVGDEKNPLVDVTFDGERILSGDLISSEPFVTILFNDDSRYFLLDDTTLISLLISDVNNDDIYTRIPFSSSNIQFYPASSSENNEAKIEWTPTFEASGEYTLRLLAEDKSGNSIGKNEYQTVFNIITEQMISNVLNYPNPFSTSTRFVYTLTGSSTPDHFKIQIMTMSGKVVREITEQEIGPLKVGTHMTDYTWDGRDEYGDKLANGVYIYRIVAKDNKGDNIDQYTTGIDELFKNGLGKMVILR
jgi:hypothetical protein